MTSNDSNSHSTSTLEGAAKIATDGNASAANGNSSQTKIAPGSRILVTGGGGYLASAIVDQLLTQGFKVRATTRTRSKLDELKKKADKTFGAGKLEVLEIKDLSVKGALDAALKDVDGVVNVASDTSFSLDLKEVVHTVVSMTQELLTSVKTAGQVKSLVSTSSRVASFNPNGSPQRIDGKPWFEEAADLAGRTEDPVIKSFMVYSASKVAGEKAVWEYVEKEKPLFRVNTILPDVNFGKHHNPTVQQFSTATALDQFSKGEAGLMDLVFSSPCWYVDVEDTAKLHVAALLDESVNHQRLWAASGPLCAFDVQEVLKEVKPDYKEKDLSSLPGKPDIIIDIKESVELLKKHYGSGFKDLKAAVRASVCV